MKASDADKLAGKLTNAELERIIAGYGRRSPVMRLAAKVVLDLRQKNGVNRNTPLPAPPPKKRKLDKEFWNSLPPTRIPKHLERKLQASFRAQPAIPTKDNAARREKKRRTKGRAQQQETPWPGATPARQEWQKMVFVVPQIPKRGEPNLPRNSAPSAPPSRPSAPTSTRAGNPAKPIQHSPRPPSEHQRLVQRVRQLCGEVRAYRYSIGHNRALLHDLDDTTLGYIQRASAARHDSETKPILDALLQSLTNLDAFTNARLVEVEKLLQTILHGHPKEWLAQARHHLGRSGSR